MRSAAIILLLCLCRGEVFSQDAFLRISHNTALTHKKFEIFTGDLMQFKLKKKRGFLKKKVMAVTDSTFIFDDDSEIPYRKIKFVRVYKYNYVIAGFRKFFFRFAAVTMTLDAFNNVILDRPTVVDKKAVIAAAGMVAAGLILRRMEFKRIRFNRYKAFQAIRLDYNHLAPAK